MSATDQLERLRQYEFVEGNLERIEDIRLALDATLLDVAVVRKNGVYICLADGGTVPEDKLHIHMAQHTCRKVKNEEICTTCFRVAGTGAKSAKLHYESSRHATVVSKLQSSKICMDCMMITSPSHKCKRYVVSLQDLRQQANVVVDVHEHQPSQAYAHHLEKTSYGAGQAIVKTDSIITMISLTGKKVPKTEMATMPPLCMTHLGHLGLSHKKAYPNLQIVQTKDDMECMACKNAKRLNNGPDFRKQESFYVMTQISNLTYPYRRDMRGSSTSSDDATLPQILSILDFHKTRDADRKFYVYDPVGQNFVFVGLGENAEEVKSQLAFTAEIDYRQRDPTSAFKEQQLKNRQDVVPPSVSPPEAISSPVPTDETVTDSSLDSAEKEKAEACANQELSDYVIQTLVTESDKITGNVSSDEGDQDVEDAEDDIDGVFTQRRGYHKKMAITEKEDQSVDDREKEKEKGEEKPLKSVQEKKDTPYPTSSTICSNPGCKAPAQGSHMCLKHFAEKKKKASAHKTGWKV